VALQKPKKYLVFTLNDHYEIKMKPLIFGACILLLTIATVTIPYIAFLTVPTYLTILFAAVSEKIDIRTDDVTSQESLENE
jgi:hypothetical protein